MFLNTFIYLFSEYLPVLVVTNTKSVHFVSCPPVGWAAPAVRSPSRAPPALWVRTPEPAALNTSPASSVSCQDRPSTTMSTDTCQRAASVTSTPLPTPPALPPPTCSLVQNKERRCWLCQDGIKGSQFIYQVLGSFKESWLLLLILSLSKTEVPLTSHWVAVLWQKHDPKVFSIHTFIFFIFLLSNLPCYLYKLSFTQEEIKNLSSYVWLPSTYWYSSPRPTKVKCFRAIFVILTEMAAL